MTPEEHWQAGRQAIKERHFDEAVEHLEAVVEDDEDDVDALCLLGACYGQLGRYLEGEHFLSIACEKAPEMAVAHYNLGRLFEERGRMEMAIRSFENALRADRGYDRARAALKKLHATLSPDLRNQEEEDESAASAPGQPAPRPVRG